MYKLTCTQATVLATILCVPIMDSRSQPVPSTWASIVRIQVDNCIEAPGGTGTGIIISSSGLVLTAKHVVLPEQRLVDKACQYSVLGEGLAGSLPAKLARQSSDPLIDAALLQIEKVPRGGLKGLALGTAAGLPVGTSILSIGYDRGDLKPQQHVGKVTAPGDGSRGIGKVDALFTNGSSGGAILLEGCDVVIGMAKSGFAGEAGQLRITTVDPVVDALSLKNDPSVSKIGLPCRPWPNFAGKSRYVVSPDDSHKKIPLLLIPPASTVEFDPAIGEVNWSAGLLSFGPDTTIDLVPRAPTSDTAVAGNTTPGQPSWGKSGARGGDGDSGLRGDPGRAMTLDVGNTWQASGFLWIRTDGGNGQAGGRGGNGQTGGGSSCVLIRENAGPGGDGGDGGRGGDGGNGGDSARVSLSGPVVVDRRPCGACGNSTRPANGPAGALVVAGAPGCGGSGGGGGTGGDGGGPAPYRECNIEVGPLRIQTGLKLPAGRTGRNGAPGRGGDPGRCTGMR